VARTPFDIVYDPRVKDHLKAIERKHHTLIRRTIEVQLTYEPNTATRDRKPLLRETQLDADWELRFGPDNCFRVFYAVDPDAARVDVLAIGVKRGSRLFVGGEEITL
jgi:mRNA-degrading endonuclease RelE of RelBE toxin-antitoxin system